MGPLSFGGHPAYALPLYAWPEFAQPGSSEITPMEYLYYGDLPRRATPLNAWPQYGRVGSNSLGSEYDIPAEEDQEVAVDLLDEAAKETGIVDIATHLEVPWLNKSLPGEYIPEAKTAGEWGEEYHKLTQLVKVRKQEKELIEVLTMLLGSGVLD